MTKYVIILYRKDEKIMNKQEIIDLLKSFELGQPFTIEQLVRTIGQNKGEKWAGVFEVQLQAYEQFHRA